MNWLPTGITALRRPNVATDGSSNGTPRPRRERSSPTTLSRSRATSAIWRRRSMWSPSVERREPRWAALDERRDALLQIRMVERHAHQRAGIVARVLDGRAEPAV